MELTDSHVADDDETVSRQVPSRRKNTPLQRRLGVRLVEGAYVMVLGFLAVQLIYTLLTPVPRPTVTDPRTGGQDVIDLSVLGRFDPFIGSAPAVSAATSARVEETQLDLKLVGVYAADEQSSAVIRTRDGKQRPYFIGDEIVRGVTLEEVRANQVILRRGGVSEGLSLEGREGFDSVEAGSPTAPLVAAAPSALDDYLRVMAPEDEQGLVLFAGQNPTFFQASGLLDGDRLLAINGIAVNNSVEETLSVLTRQMAQGTVTLTVERRGTPVDIRVDPMGFNL